MEEYVRPAGERFYLDIKALPGASKTELGGLKDGRLRIRIAAVPEDGRANTELRAFLAKLLGCAKRDIVPVRGEKSRLKTLSIPGPYREKLEALVAASCGAGGKL